jgi:putative membrane-bound dehydrogenase-like protein
VSPERFNVPDGFRIERVVGPTLAGSLWAMTFDDKARLIVSQQQGPIFTLIDTDGDGECDQAIRFDSRVHSCQGLCYIDGSLYAVGDGPDGPALYRLTDKDGDDQADTLETLGSFKSGGMGEHAPHGVVYGPDGKLYISVGNHAQAPDPVNPDSPLNQFAEDQLLPRYADARGHARGIMTPGGTVCRIELDGSNWTRIAGGFRNAYDIAFNADGEVFTYDSDMEWDENLPWYRPTRVNHVIPSGDYGWRHGSGKWPAYYFDSLPTTVDIGRGSPCGVIFYDHDQFPEKYRGAFFITDWSMGRIIATFMDRDGGTYGGSWEAFATGRPLNVNDVEVGPDGSLYFSIGGRNTEGGVYKVIYGDDAPKASLTGEAPAGADAVVRQKQPDAAWARARARAVKKNMGASWQPALLKIARDTSRPARESVRALTALQQFGPPADAATLIELSRDERVEIRATAVFLLGLHASSATRAALADRLADNDRMVRRRACESFVRNGLTPPVERLVSLLGDGDQWVRHAARNALLRAKASTYRTAVLRNRNPRVAIEGMLALIHHDATEATAEDIAAKQASLFERDMPDDLLLDAIRLAEVTHIRAGDNGNVPEAMNKMRPALLRAFDRTDPRIKRESARLLAYLQEPKIIDKILDGLENDPSREQQIHYAYCLRTMTTGWTKPQRDRFIDWYGETRDWSGGASFSGYLDILWDATLALLPPDERDEILSDLDELSDGDDPVAQAIAQAKAAQNQHDPVKLKQFVLSDPAGKRGDVKSGREVFAKAGCAACHKFGDQAGGRGVGPDLTTVASRFKRTDILDSILEPNKVISDQYKAINVLTTDGAVIAGIPIKNDSDAIVLQRTNGTEMTIPRAEVARSSQSLSLMPEGTLNVLTLEQIADLFAYLESTPATNGQNAGN